MNENASRFAVVVVVVVYFQSDSVIRLNQSKEGEGSLVFFVIHQLMDSRYRDQQVLACINTDSLTPLGNKKLQ